MKFQHGQFVVEFRVVNFAPINEVEVVLRFAQRENLDPERGEDVVGVAGTATGEAAEEQAVTRKGRGIHQRKEGCPINQVTVTRRAKAKETAAITMKAWAWAIRVKRSSLCGSATFFGVAMVRVLAVGERSAGGV
jgi:hypothetical protein